MQSIYAESAAGYHDNNENRRIHYSLLSSAQDDDQPITPTLIMEESKFQRWEPISEPSYDASLRYDAIMQPQYDIYIRNYADGADDGHNAYTLDYFGAYHDN